MRKIIQLAQEYGRLLMPNTLTSMRPGRLEASSLAELYAAYEGLFLQGDDYRRELDSDCGLKIVAFDRNFLHLVRLKKKDGDQIIDFFENIQEEKPRIRAVTDGFGDYLVDGSRWPHLPAGLDTMLRPHAVFRMKTDKTASLAFLKHYGDKPYPVMLSLVGHSASDGCLIPVTCFPTRLNQAKSRFKQWSDGLIWRKGDPPLEGA